MPRQRATPRGGGAPLLALLAVLAVLLAAVAATFALVRLIDRRVGAAAAARRTRGRPPAAPRPP